MSELAIRPATDSDWPRIFAFFAAICAEGETYAFPLDLTLESGREWWMANDEERPQTLESGDRFNQAVVAELDGRIIGSAKMGPNRPGHGDHIGTASFMVDPDARGHGVGRALGEYVVGWHRRCGYHGIQFNAVVETNVAAVRLWQDLGWRIVGTVPEAFRSPRHGLVGLHVMYLALSAD